MSERLSGTTAPRGPQFPHSEAPPIGVMPAWRWREKRIIELLEASQRFMAAGPDGAQCESVQRWLREADQLLENLDDGREPKSQLSCVCLGCSQKVVVTTQDRIGGKGRWHACADHCYRCNHPDCGAPATVFVNDHDGRPYSRCEQHRENKDTQPELEQRCFCPGCTRYAIVKCYDQFMCGWWYACAKHCYRCGRAGCDAPAVVYVNGVARENAAPYASCKEHCEDGDIGPSKVELPRFE